MTLLPSASEREWENSKDSQKYFMEKILIPYVKKRGYIDMYNKPSFGDKFYSVSGMNILSKWEPNVFLLRYKEKRDPRDPEQSSSNAMSISLHGPEDFGCYRDNGDISVFIMSGDIVKKTTKLDVPFAFQPVFDRLHKKDAWGDEKRFVGYWLSYFDRMPFLQSAEETKTST